MKKSLLLIGAAVWCTFTCSQSPKDTSYVRDHYTKMEKYITIRDGNVFLLPFTCLRINLKNIPSNVNVTVLE